jgi:hypothetical protein
MKKYTIDISLTGLSTLTASNVTSFQRSSVGVDINGIALILPGWDSERSYTLLNRYNNLNNVNVLYKGTKRVNLLPESIESNTFMTTNGLVGVFYTSGSNKFLTVLDLFDTGNFPYSEIIPIDGSILEEYVTDLNPEYKKVFVASKDGEEDYFEINNQKIYEESEFSYFLSNLDYNLPTDDYGYYKIASVSWSTYETTEEFSLLKKQFYLIEGPADLEVYYYNGTSYVLKTPVEVGTQLYWFPNLAIEINSDNNLLKLKLKSATVNYSTIIIY